MSRLKTFIIGLLIALLGPALAGCSAVRLGYANGPQLSWWWIDGYFDFDRDQAPQVKFALDRWFAWHRESQLPAYVAFLARARQAVVQPLSAAAVCGWQDQARAQLEPALQRAIAEFADIVPSLGEAQFQHLAQRYAKINDEMRGDFLQPDLAERRRQSLKRTVERAERFYGTLTEAQLKLVADGIAASPFDPERWLAERAMRQRDAVKTLRQLVAERADRDQRVAGLRALVQRTERSTDPGYRAYYAKLSEFNCALVARLHDSTTAEQRQHAGSFLQGWESDLRSLLQPEAPRPPGSN